MYKLLILIVMSIPKFRLAWKGGSQEQMNILEKMALLLENILIELQRANGKLTSIDNGVTSVDGKMSTQLLLSQEIVDNTSCACNALKDVISNQMEQTQILNSDLLLSQQIADNTNCACNALGDVNGKLDEIIDLLDKPNPDPLYEFVLNTNSYTVTESDIQNGYFEILGYSLKDGELFDSVIIDYLNIFFSYIQVLQGGIIRIGLMPLVGDNGIDSTFNLRQSESDLVRSLYLKYVPVVTIPDEFRILAQPTQVDYLDTRTEMTIDVVSYVGGSMLLPAVVAPWSIASYTQHSFGSEGKSFYRLKVKPNVSLFSDLVKVPLSIQISNSFGSDTVVFSISGDEFGLELLGSNYSLDGVKGYDPMTYQDVVRFAFIQNYLSFLNGGVEGIDWRKPSNIQAYFHSEYTGNMGVVKTGGRTDFSFILTGDPQYVNTFYDNVVGLKFIVGEYYYSLNLPVVIQMPTGLPLMGANTLTTSSNLFYTIPLAECPPLGDMLPMQWQTSNFDTFEYPLLPNGYSGNRAVGVIVPVTPDLFPDSYVNRIGFHENSLFLMQYGWSMALKNDTDVIKDTYQYYLIVDNKACYAAVVIS